MFTAEFVSGLCQEFCSGSSSQDAPMTLARAIRSGEVDLLSLVEALGVFLTSKAVDTRCQGTRLLSEVLVRLHAHRLPQDDVHYLISFFCDRLKDRAVVLPYVLRGLHAMVVHQNTSSDDVVVVSRAIFSEVYTQSLSQGERRLVYTIMDYFLTDHIEAARKMGSEFVLGYIQAMDGEKDPRNLIIALNSVHRIVLHLPFDVLAEDLFEVTSCYFPIDFTPPPNDPHAISKEQLVLALRKCLTATPKFTEFCLPLMLEKMSSDLLSAKLDSLLTVAAGCEVFRVKDLHTYLQPLWIAIREEIFQSVNQEVEAAGVKCLAAMSKALSPGCGGDRGGGGEFTEMVLKDCERHLVEPDLRLLSPASRMLLAVAVGCGQACTAITTSTVPLLLEQFHNRSVVCQKKALLQVLLEFINTVKLFSREDVANSLASQKTALVSLIVTAMRGREQSLVVAGLDLCCGLLVLSAYLEPDEVGMLAEHVKQLALSHNDASVRERASISLARLAQCFPLITRDTVISSLLQLFTLNTSAQPLEMDGLETHSESETISLPNIAHLLASISVDLDLQTLTLPVFLALLDQLAGTLSFTREHMEVAEAVTGSLCRIVEKAVETPEGISLVHETVVSRILLLCIVPSLTSQPSSLPTTRHLFTEDTVLKPCLSLLRTFTLAANSEYKITESWVSLIHQIFLENKSPLLPPDSSFLPLTPSSPVQQTRLVGTLTHTIGVMTREIVCSQASSFLPRLLEQATCCPDELSSSQSAMCYASIINKMESGELERVLGSDVAGLWQIITASDSVNDQETRTRSLTTWLWLTKALVIRSHPQGRDCALKLFDLFGDARLSHHVADGFSVILEDSDEVLNAKCHAVTRLMYKQQFFVEVVPELVKRFGEAPLVRRQYFLRALAHIMHSVPKQVLLGELTSLLPLLLESLDSDDTGLCGSTLEGLHSLIQDAPSIMSDHVTTLVPRLLTLAITPDSMKIRCSALSCLNALSHLPRHLVYPYQSQVVQALAPCLDDKKRLVRKEAVKTRSNWFVLDAV